MALKGLRVGEAALPYAMAALAGSAAAVIMMLAPQAPLERLVGESGLPAVLGAAEPPLGTTARAMLAAAAAVIVAAIVFSGLSALEGLPGIRFPNFTKFAHGTPKFRQEAGAEEPEAAPERRRPIFAREDLGAPFDSVTADAKAAEVTPIGAPPRVALGAPCSAPPASGRGEGSLFERMRDPEAAPHVKNQEPRGDEPSLAELVRRLEAGMERRRLAATGAAQPAQPDMDAALRDALGTLQRMAARSRA